MGFSPMAVCTEYEARRERLYFTHDFPRPGDSEFVHAEPRFTQTTPFFAFELKDDERLFPDSRL